MNDPTATDHDLVMDLEFREELTEDGYDLPELASTMEEADARLRASIFLGIMRSIEHQMDENDAECKALVAWTKERHAERQARLDAQKGWVRITLESLYGFMRPPKGKKSLNLIGGKIGTKGQRDTLDVEDDEVVIEWVQADTRNRPEQVIRTKYEINRVELLGYMEAIAEQDGIGPKPPGVTMGEHPDKFFATPAEK